jgi:predicted AAA+ superfamily ATPase
MSFQNYLIRRLRVADWAAKKSLFLFGARATGKSSLLRHELPNVPIIDLLDSDLYLELSARPAALENFLQPRNRLVIIDEVQRVPDLLNEVHRQIENKGRKFILTGSSARKLKRGQANLLAGRAWTTHLYPLSWSEIPKFDLARFLHFGGLPGVYLGDSPKEDLKSYVETYLREEIQAEGLIRKIPDFHRFLRVAALCSGHMLNFEKVAQDSQTKPSTVRSYFEILEDTLVGYFLMPWERGTKRRAIKTPRFYLFDPGVARALAGIQALDPKSDLWGRAFEHFIANELRCYLSYERRDEELSYWRSAHHLEVNFIIGDSVAVEVKATAKPNSEDLKGLYAIAEENTWKRQILVCGTTRRQRVSGDSGSIEIQPWQEFLADLWAGNIF